MLKDFEGNNNNDKQESDVEEMNKKIMKDTFSNELTMEESFEKAKFEMIIHSTNDPVKLKEMTLILLNNFFTNRSMLKKMFLKDLPVIKKPN